MANAVMCIDKSLVRSKAWLALKGIAPQVYLIFRTKCQLEQVTLIGKRNKRGAEWKITNNGEITFSYKQARDKFGITKPRFARAIDQLIEKGFIDIAQSGMGIRRLSTLYSISDRWKLYGKQGFVEMKRPKAGWNPGFQKKKPSNVYVTDTSNVCVTERRILTLQTKQDGKVTKIEYKFNGDKWLEVKSA